MLEIRQEDLTAFSLSKVQKFDHLTFVHALQQVNNCLTGSETRNEQSLS